MTNAQEVAKQQEEANQQLAEAEIAAAEAKALLQQVDLTRQQAEQVSTLIGMSDCFDMCSRLQSALLCACMKQSWKI